MATVEGDHLWHVHDDTDEFFLVLEGELRISLRESTGEISDRPVDLLGIGTQQRYAKG